MTTGILAAAQLRVTAASLRGFISGLILSTAGSSATFSVAAGQCVDSTNADLLTLASSMSKSVSAWTAGSGNGALDTGTIANSTWYHVYAIKRPDTKAVDVLISLSVSSPTLPTNYTTFRRLGSMKTNGSGQWTLFRQYGEVFVWDVPVADINSVSTQSTSSVLYTLTVPTGVNVVATFVGYMQTTAAGNAITLSTVDQTAPASNTPAGNVEIITTAANALTGFGGSVVTNTSAQIRIIGSSAIASLALITQSWTDTRGRFS